MLDWNDDKCSDLVNRFGRNLEWLLGLRCGLISKVLDRAKLGGHIRWHKLSQTVAGELVEILSDFRDGCGKTYSISVGLDEFRPRAVSGDLDEAELPKLVYALGVDLDEIRKLRMDQVFQVFRSLQGSGMIESFEVKQNPTTEELNPPETSGIFHIDQCTPPSSIAPSLLRNDYSLLCPVNLHPDIGKEFDLWMQRDVTGTEAQYTADSPGMSSMGDVMSPKSDLTSFNHPTTPCSINSPPVGSGSRMTPYQSINTPLSIGSPYTKFQSTPSSSASPPGWDANVQSYPTPSTSYSPLADEAPTPPSPDTASSTKHRLLQLCRLGEDGTTLLNNNQIKQILKAEAGLLAQDPVGLLQPILKHCQADLLPALTAFGLPIEWKGKAGAVEYYRILEAVKDKERVLDPLALNLAQLLFYFNCEWLEKHGGLEGITAATFILNACSEEPKNSKSMKSRRDNITTYHYRRGRYIWIVVACLGGSILVDSGDTIQRAKIFPTKAQLNAFISLVLRTRPGSVDLCHALEPVVKAIVLGATQADLRQVIVAGSNNTVRKEQLARAYAADQEALTNQTAEETWLAEDVDSIAKKRMAEFLPDF